MFDFSLISVAHAQTAGEAAPMTDFLIRLSPMIAILAIFYFLLFRPQQQKLKEHQEMIGMLRRGDRVVTGGGIIGTIATVPEQDSDEVVVEIAQGVRVRVRRATLTEILQKPQPAKLAKETSKGDGDAPDKA